MTTSNLRERDIVKAYALFAICSAVGGFVVGAVAGMLLGVVVAMSGGDIADVQLGAGILGAVLGLLVSYYIFRAVLLRMLAPKMLGSVSIVPTSSAV